MYNYSTSGKFDVISCSLWCLVVLQAACVKQVVEKRGSWRTREHAGNTLVAMAARLLVAFLLAFACEKVVSESIQHFILWDRFWLASNLVK